MHKPQPNDFINRFLIIFVLGFILTLPRSNYFFPNIGTRTSAFIEGIFQSLLDNPDLYLGSDSLLMYIYTASLLLLSLICAFVWKKLQPKNTYHTFWLRRISTYYLAFALFLYGFNKLFKYQFGFPEPNILFTPVGNLSPGMLYWTSMGTSYSYNLFSGLIEIIPAFLLLFSRTRLLGALIALGVMVNVFMINIGFGIHVKLYSLFLLFLSVLIIWPSRRRLYNFFIRQTVTEGPAPELIPNLGFISRYQKWIKVAIIFLLLAETTSIYFKYGSINGDQLPRIAYHGAYDIEEETSEIKRIFIHQDGYFITQDQKDTFTSYEFQSTDNNFIITNNAKETIYLWMVTLEENERYLLKGNFFGHQVEWRLAKINLEQLRINTTQFHWVSD